jgi:hypothetical protein
MYVEIVQLYQWFMVLFKMQLGTVKQLFNRDEVHFT